MPIQDLRKPFQQMMVEFRNDSDRAEEFVSEDIREEDVGDMFLLVTETISGNESDLPIARLFKESALDVRNPFHWHYLMEGLASIFFYERKKAGAKPIRTEEYHKTLAKRLDAFFVTNPRKTDVDAAKHLIKSFEEYGKLEPQSITRMIGPLRSAGIVKSRNARSLTSRE